MPTMYQHPYEELEVDDRVHEALGSWFAEKAERWLADRGIRVVRFDCGFVEHYSHMLRTDMGFVIPTIQAAIKDLGLTTNIFAGEIDAQIVATFVAVRENEEGYRDLTNEEHCMIVLMGTGNHYYSDVWKELVTEEEKEQYENILWTVLVDEVERE